MILSFAPQPVRRPIRLTMHFPRQTKAEIAQLADPFVRRLLLKRWPTRPHGHDLLELKCGHVVIRVRPAATVVWRPQLCEMCTRAAARRGTAVKEAIVSKKSASVESKSWGQVYKFMKAAKDEPSKETVVGAVYAALRKRKSGTVEEIQEVAERDYDLKSLTKQDRYVQTQVMLRRLAAEGVAKVERPGDDAVPPAKKAKKAKKSLTVKAKKVKAKKEEEPDEDEDEDVDAGDDE